MATVFVSYRRSDSQDITGRIYDRLIEKYTSRCIFKDVNSIPAGVSFPKHIRSRLRKTDVMLVIIGRTWLHCMDEHGQRRLDDPNDFVRLEVELGLRCKMPVIPVLVANARMPQAAQLPPTMQRLASRSGIWVRADPDFNSDMAKLVNWIEHLMDRMGGKSRGSRRGDPATPAAAEKPRGFDWLKWRWSRRTLALFLCFALLGTLLLAATFTFFDAGYNLADRNLPEGAVVRDESHFTMADGTLTSTFPKEAKTKKHSEEIHRTIDTQIVRVTRGDPTKLKITFAEHEEFGGRSMHAEKVGGNWIQTLIGDEPTSAQARALKTEWGGIDDTYPERRIKPGDTWKLEGPRMRRFVQKSADALFFEGTADLTFESVEKKEGEQCALIGVEYRYKLRELDKENREVAWEVSMRGHVYRSISRFVDVETNFSGESVRTFTKIEDGQLINVTVAGPVTLRGRQSRR